MNIGYGVKRRETKNGFVYEECGLLKKLDDPEEGPGDLYRC